MAMGFIKFLEFLVSTTLIKSSKLVDKKKGAYIISNNQ